MNEPSNIKKTEGVDKPSLLVQENAPKIDSGVRVVDVSKVDSSANTGFDPNNLNSQFNHGSSSKPITYEIDKIPYRSDPVQVSFYNDTKNFQEYHTKLSNQKNSLKLATQWNTDQKVAEAERKENYINEQRSLEVGENNSVVRKKTGEPILISVKETSDESRTRIISEKIVEHEIKIPTRVLRENIIEHVTVIPEKKYTEHIENESHFVKEKIVEIAKPRIVEKVIEVPQIDYVDNIIYQPKIITKLRKKLIPVDIVKENVIYEEEKEINYIDKPVKKIIKREIPRVVQQDDIQYVDIQVPGPVEYEDVEKIEYIQQNKYIDVKRKLPIPVEVETIHQYCLPKLKPVYGKKEYCVYLPRFIEVPVPSDMLSPNLYTLTQEYLGKIHQLRNTQKPLCEVESLAADIKKSDIAKEVSTIDMLNVINNAWFTDTLKVVPTPTN